MVSKIANTWSLIPDLFTKGFQGTWDSWWGDNLLPDYEDKFNWFRRLLISWKVTTILSTYLGIVVNSIIFIDLFLTLNNPFFPRKKRMIKYRLIVMTVVLAISVTLTYSIINDGTSVNLYDYKR